MNPNHRNGLLAFPPWALGLVLLGLFGNVFAYFYFGLLPDEAYYWTWSKRLAAGYFDNGPLVAWVIWPFAVLGGDQWWAIRFPGALSWLVSTWVAYDLAKRLFGSRAAGMWAVIVWTSLPIVQGGFHIVSPDAPLVIFTILTYYFACRAVLEARNDFWLVAGGMAGLAMISKYNALFVPGGIFLALFFSMPGRKILRTPAPRVRAISTTGPWVHTMEAATSRTSRT